MELILKIARRNLFRHRGHSFVIGTILFLGAMLMTMGNGVVTGMDQGLHKTVVRGFTGDLVLVSDKQIDDNVFLEMMGRAVAPIHNYADIRAFLSKEPLVERFLPAGKNTAMLINEDGGMSTFIYVMGVDFGKYRAMFPGTLDLIEGRMPVEGGPGLLLPKGARKEILDQTNIWFIPAGTRLDTSHLEGDAKAHVGDLSIKTSMVMMGFNEDNSSTDVRLGIDGVFRYRSLNTIFGSFVLMDIESFRECLGYFLASEKTLGRVSGEDSALLSMEGGALDEVFSQRSLLTAKPAESAGAPPAVDWSRRADSARSSADLEAGTYNLVMVFLKAGVDADKAVARLNAELRDGGLGIRAVTWKQSLGPVGSMATLIKAALFVFVSFLFVVAVIIIINTLSMAALERTPEIGMMRAIGARRGLIGGIFLAETALLSFFFGGLGMAVGAAAVKAISFARISSDNDMLQLFFGGDVFHPMLTAGDIMLGCGQLALVTAAAVIYPLRLAQRVTPLEAVYKE